MKEDVYTQLRAARREKGLTQQEVADQIGMHRVEYNRIEGGAGTTVRTLQRAARLLGYEVALVPKK